MEYLAKINVTSGVVDIPHTSGLSGVTAELIEDNICRLSHSSFSRATTYAFPVLIEQRDIEATMMAACGDGICDVYCYSIAGQRQSNYYFQIRIDVVS